ncbi:MAG: hypothetical protein HY923_00065 [Elusimicrobia bacterium]|nr:hypothetical protein [Elusimicrobiota bacterium]
MKAHASHKTHRAPKAVSAAVEYFSRRLEFEIGPYALKEILDESPDDVCLIDVRSPEEFHDGHIPGARNIPLEGLVAQYATLPREKEIVTYCGDITCPLSLKAALELAQKGLRVKHLFGGIAEWNRRGFPLKTTLDNEEGGPME